MLREVTDSHGVECESDGENPASLNTNALCSFETSGSDYVWWRHIAQERSSTLVRILQEGSSSKLRRTGEFCHLCIDKECFHRHRK